MTTFEEHLDADTLAAEVFFLRANSTDATIVLVEGDNDLRLFQKLLSVDVSNYVNCFGKTNALQTVHILDQAAVAGFLCFVDADFSRLGGQLPPHSCNVIVSPHHDFEVMMFKSDALSRLLSEDGSQSKLRKLRDKGVTPLEVLLAACVPLGILRLYSAQTGVGLKFKGIRYRSLNRCLNVDEHALVKEVYDNSRIHEGREAALDFLRKFDRSKVDVEQLVSGHDLAAALSVGLRSLLGSRTPAQCEVGELEAKLRIGFGKDLFATTQLYADIRTWEVSNAPYVCM